MKHRGIKLICAIVALAAVHYGLMLACGLLIFNPLTAIPFHVAMVLMFPGRLLRLEQAYWIFITNSFVWAGALVRIYHLFAGRWRKRALIGFISLLMVGVISLSLCYSALWFGWPARDGRLDVAELLDEKSPATTENYSQDDGFRHPDAYYRFCGPPELLQRLTGKYDLVELPVTDQQFYQFKDRSYYWWNPGKQQGLVYYGYDSDFEHHNGGIQMVYDKNAGRFYVHRF
jgi:hypothetical protein